MNASMDPRLKEAARTGNFNDFYSLIAEKPNLLMDIDTESFTETPLHVAAAEGQIAFAIEMMNLRPAFARTLNQAGLSPMHIALQNGKTQLVYRLLKMDKDLVRVKGREGKTPFHLVVEQGDEELLTKFLEACPECIRDETVHDDTAFHIALKCNKFETFEFLVEGIDPNCDEENGGVWEERVVVNWKDHEGNTLLHVAAAAGQIDFATKMMNLRPAFGRTLNRSGSSPMHLALEKGKTQLVQQLLKMDKDLVRVKGREGKTPFHYVVALGDEQLLTKFLQACPQCIQDVTVDGDTALHIALKCNKSETFVFLVKWILNYREKNAGGWEERLINSKDKQGNTLLHVAAMKNNLEAVKLLLNECQGITDVTAKNLEDATALEYIIKYCEGINVCNIL